MFYDNSQQLSQCDIALFEKEEKALPVEPQISNRKEGNFNFYSKQA